MSLQPFSHDFAREFERIKTLVTTLDQKMQDFSRTQGSMYDRVFGGDEVRQFFLFCDVVDGQKGESYDLKPAYTFYGLEENKAEPGESPKLLKDFGVPQFVIEAFNADGLVSGKNCVDFRYSDATRNLHGVNAPQDTEGAIAVLDIDSSVENDEGPGSVLAMFTRKPDGDVHVGFYAKNDLEVLCGNTQPPEGFRRNGSTLRIPPSQRTGMMSRLRRAVRGSTDDY